MNTVIVKQIGIGSATISGQAPVGGGGLQFEIIDEHILNLKGKVEIIDNHILAL